MNPDLIRQYYAENSEAGLNKLLTLFEVITSERDRAEQLSRAHLHTIKKLSESFAAITEPATGKKVSDPSTSDRSPNTPTQHPTSKTKNKTPQTLDDLDL